MSFEGPSPEAPGPDPVRREPSRPEAPEPETLRSEAPRSEIRRPETNLKPNIRHIPYRRLGTSEVQLRYLEDDPEMRPFLGQRPRNPAELLRNAPMQARRLVDRGELAESLVAYAVRHGAPDAVLENARAVARDHTFMVVTGQQPGLFGGPLYCVHKIATTIRLARELSAEPGAPKVVPIFWNHSDDHDLDEVNRSFLVNANHDVQRVRLDLPQAGGEPIRDVRIGRLLAGELESAASLLPDSEFREEVLASFQPRHPDEHFGDALARMLFAMFGEDGLLVIEPRDLPASAFEVLPRWCEAADKIRSRLGVVTEHLTDIGLDVTMDPSATLMFQMTGGGRRTALSDADPIRSPQALSPGVLLRPLWQDACLPTIGFVVGPGEFSYLAIAGPLYKTLGVPQPVFVPRASLTLLEPSMVKSLNRFGLDIPDLDRDPETIAAEFESEGEDTIDDALSALGEQLREEFERLTVLVKTADAQMAPLMTRTRGKLVDDIDKLRKKLRKARESRAGTGLRQVRRLVANLRPRGRLQERVLPVLPFLVKHGMRGIADRLLDAADPFTVDHGVVEL